LDKNNPAGIVDPVFGLLGNAAAAGGQVRSSGFKFDFEYRTDNYRAKSRMSTAFNKQQLTKPSPMLRQLEMSKDKLMH
jgi:hypothetical protein